MTKCLLCGQRSPIKNSHIVPALFVRRLKRGTPVKSLRDSNNVTRPVQDGWKGPFYCRRCESLFSGWERHFATQLYDPYLRDESMSVVIDTALVLFLLSVHFRYIEYAKERNKGLPPSNGTLEALLSRLRAALLKEEIAAEVYLYVTPLKPMTTLTQLPPGCNTYFFEVIDGYVFEWKLPSGESVWISYVKVPALMFFLATRSLSDICRKPDILDPYETRVDSRFDPTLPASIVLMETVLDRVRQAAESIQVSYAQMPDSQIESIISQIQSDPDYKKSRAHKSYLLDLELVKKMKCGSR